MALQGRLWAWSIAAALVLAQGCAAGGEAAKSAAAASSNGTASQAGPTAPKAAEPAKPAEAAVVLLPAGQEPLRVKVEVARTEPERRLGLMHRKHLDADAGMLFLFERPQKLSFWMRNTYVPLDMIFITDQLLVLGVVENAEPLTESPRAVPGDSQYVLEVNAGYARAHGIGAGTVVRFEGVEKVAASGN
jgi:uncharacterized membrane protein (UPF0127 family)